MSDVTSLDDYRPSATNRACSCGSQWWVAAVVVDDESGSVGGRSTPLVCSACGRDEHGDLRRLDDLPGLGGLVARARAAALREAAAEVRTEARWQAMLRLRPLRQEQGIGARLAMLEQILIDRAAQVEQVEP